MEICLCLPTLYTVDEERDEASPIMIPVSSTAIPIDDLPVFKVSGVFIRFAQALHSKIRFHSKTNQSLLVYEYLLLK